MYRVALISTEAFFVLLAYTLAAIGMAYILIRVYRDRTRKVRKLR